MSRLPLSPVAILIAEHVSIGGEGRGEGSVKARIASIFARETCPPHPNPLPRHDVGSARKTASGGEGAVYPPADASPQPIVVSARHRTSGN